MPSQPSSLMQMSLDDVAQAELAKAVSHGLVHLRRQHRWHLEIGHQVSGVAKFDVKIFWLLCSTLHPLASFLTAKSFSHCIVQSFQPFVEISRSGLGGLVALRKDLQPGSRRIAIGDAWRRR